MIITFFMEKMWNERKPVTEKLPCLSSETIVVHSCMMYENIIKDLIHVKNYHNIFKLDTELKIEQTRY